MYSYSIGIFTHFKLWIAFQILLIDVTFYVVIKKM